jgi:glutamate synthase (NADPH/NADH) large chain
VVVVLGPTGRNFAAGMSGGIAYVLDEKGDFERRCNLAMIDLEPVEAEEEVMRRLANQGGDLESHGLVDIFADMENNDAERLHRLIERHSHYTNSAKARAIIEDWSAWLPKFKKVMPVEYRQALKKMSDARTVETTGAGMLEIGVRAAKA